MSISHLIAAWLLSNNSDDSNSSGLLGILALLFMWGMLYVTFGTLVAIIIVLLVVIILSVAYVSYGVWKDKAQPDAEGFQTTDTFNISENWTLYFVNKSNLSKLYNLTK